MAMDKGHIQAGPYEGRADTVPLPGRGERCLNRSGYPRWGQTRGGRI